MNGDKATSILSALLRGYKNFFRGVAAFGIGTILLGAVGVVLVYPLWLFATSRPDAYTAVAMILFGAAVVAAATRWFVRESSRSEEGARAPLRTIGRIAVRGLAVATLALGGYVDVLLFQIGRPLPAAILAVALLAVLGFLFSGARRPRGSRGPDAP